MRRTLSKISQGADQHICRTYCNDNSKQIHSVGERFTLKIHQNTTNYSYTVDASVSSSDEGL